MRANSIHALSGILGRVTSMRILTLSGLLPVALLATTACNSDQLGVPNYNNVTQSSALSNPVAAVPLLAAGIQRDDGAQRAAFVLGVGILGREAYNYNPTLGTATSGWLTSDVGNSTSSGGGALWTFYTTLRDVDQMRNVANKAAAGTFTVAQLSAINGFLDTEEAMALLYLIDTRDDLGVPIQILPGPTQVAPFVSRDSVFTYIAAKLASAQTELAAGGTAFPFTLHAGFVGFNTPSTFAKFAAGLAARVNAYRASRGIGGCTALAQACYQAVLQNLGASWISTTGSLQTGPFEVYSTAAGDVTNAISIQVSPFVLAHAHVDSGVQTTASGARDARFSSKTCSIKATGPGSAILGIPTTWSYCLLYSTASTPIPIMRNEELILLRAEAEYFTGDATDALADINLVRTTSGGLAARGAFANQADFIAELLYNRRESLMFEGHRWLDVRRFGQLSGLPIDSNDPLAVSGMTPQVVVSRLPVPAAECLYRANLPAALRAPTGSGC